MEIPTRSPISPMSGPSPATPPHAIQTGSWLAPEALTDTRGARRIAAALAVIAVALSLATEDAYAVRARHSAHRAAPPAARPVPYPQLDLPFEISNSQYLPLTWPEIAGWNDDDHL